MVVKLNGARCTCGRNGCVEAYAGRKAMELHARELHDKGHHTDLFKIMEKRGRERLTSGIWARAAKKKDPLALELIDRAIEHLGPGVASTCITGTLTSLMAELVTASASRHLRLLASVFLVYGGGALIGAVLQARSSALLGWLPFVCVTAVVVNGLVLARSCGNPRSECRR